MSESIEQTRRAFLLRLARATVFTPPLIATLKVQPLAAWGEGEGEEEEEGGEEAVGGTSPTSQIDTGLRFEFDEPLSDQPAARPGPSAPWATRGFGGGNAGGIGGAGDQQSRR